MSRIESNKNYSEKIYHVEGTNSSYFRDKKIWVRWSGYRKGRSALDGIRDMRNCYCKFGWKFRIRIVKK